MTNLDCALGYAKLGWKVFPLSANSKLPTKNSNGFKDATTDEAIIKKWWEENPKYNIGVEASSVGMVLDVDNKNGKNGFVPLSAFESEYGDLPVTAVQLTPSGGKQFLFKLPPNTEIPCSSGMIADGIDIRSTGGYFVAPPSFLIRTPDYPFEGNYDWVSDQSPHEIELATAPDWLLRLCLPRPSTKKLEILDVIANGKRNDTLFRFASKLRNTGMNYSEISAATLILNTTRCSPPLSEDEVDVIVKSSCKYEPSKEDLWKSLKLDFAGSKRPFGNADNVSRILSAMPDLQGKIWFDEFHNKVFTTWRSSIPREWSDDLTIALQIFIQRVVGISKIGKDAVLDAVTDYAHSDVRNEPKDWMRSIKWDEKHRIDRFFVDYAGTEHTAHSLAVGKYFWVSMVSRVFEPGCQVDSMVILEGKQGTYKSTLFNVVGGKFYAEATHDVKSVDFFKCLEGKVIIEFAELSAFSRSEINLIKKIVTCRSDRYRASYGRLPSDHARTSVFAGSTNDEEYLGDPTGARRFLPLKIDTIKVSDIERDREQLFAEAVVQYRAGIEWWVFPEETITAQEKRRVYDEWESIVNEFIYKKEVFTMKEVASHLGINETDLDMQTQKRIGKILQMSGEFERTVERINGKNTRCWKRLKCAFDVHLTPDTPVNWEE